MQINHQPLIGHNVQKAHGAPLRGDEPWETLEWVGSPPSLLAGSRAGCPSSSCCSSSRVLISSDSIARIGTYSLDIRPSHSTTALALLVVMRSTTPRRPVGAFLNATAARAVSLTLSPRLIISPFIICL